MFNLSEKEGTFRRESRQPSTDNVRHSLLSARRDTISPTASGDILSKAKSRTLKMTVLIVIIFVCCWSPYQLIHVWYYLHRSSAEQVNLLLQETLFIFGVSSCVVDPYVYGLYSMGLWNEVECISRINCTSHSQTPSEDRRGSFASPKDNMEVYSLGTLKKCCPNLAERKGIPSHEDSNKRDEPSPTPATARVIM
ncbi:hypothetical protein BV898_12677 [Hypsibius exemplaris]|uniref:G-protein coupled receptors family 1 profile domain-containing protein n=1 Tax=Hypsibius exemplaris TaxID=2072580 RepID=A0A1W0WD73_HYPEX|nr:hypothetical protein BV898_12677 [Hypsibius exemplaris]